MSLTNKIKSANRRRLYQNLTTWCEENGFSDASIELGKGGVVVKVDGAEVVLDVAERIPF